MISQSTKQVLHLLNDRCECTLKNLRDLVEIHRRMDASADWQLDGDPAYRPKLHKAFLHIVAITSWQMDGDVFHVMAPEIRAAVKALDELARESLPQQLARGGRSQHSFLVHEKELALFAHPTLASLSASRGSGGLGSTGYVRYLCVAYVALSQLMATYAFAITKVAEQVDPASVDEVNRMITMEASASMAIDWKVILASAD